MGFGAGLHFVNPVRVEAELLGMNCVSVCLLCYTCVNFACLFYY